MSRGSTAWAGKTAKILWSHYSHLQPHPQPHPQYTHSLTFTRPRPGSQLWLFLSPVSSLSLQRIGVGWRLGFPGEGHSLPRAPLTIWKLENEASIHLLGNKTQSTIYNLIVAVICRSCVYLISPLFFFLCSECSWRLSVGPMLTWHSESCPVFHEHLFCQGWAAKSNPSLVYK